jgi:dienelactone hydrolase
MNAQKFPHFSFCSLLVICICLLSAACSHATRPARKTVAYGAIARKVCKADTTQAYEVYLPSAYNASRKWPVIFAFDSHADGKLAVEHLQEASELFGYIIIGSDNSRNGLTTITHTLDVLVADVNAQYAVDGNRQYAAGFSGGGRVASMLAGRSGKIRGVITCGAGFSDFQTSAKFDIYGIAGRGDFNYTEIIDLEKQTAGTQWRCVTKLFDDTHAWPPASYLTDAVRWFELNAMRDKLIATDEEMVSETFDSIVSRCNRLVDKQQFSEAVSECQSGIAWLDGLTSIKKLEKKRKEIEALDGYRLEKQKLEQLAFMEQQLREGYLQAFQNNDQDWWANELKLLNEKIETDKDLATRQMYSRIKGFLGIVCYSYTSRAVSENNRAQADKCIMVYEIVEPANPDCFFYKAVMLDRQKQIAKAAEALRLAIKYGFKEMGKIQTDISAGVQKMVF